MKRGFTLIELLVVISIISTLAAILFPIFVKAKLAANKTADLTHMKQVGLAFTLYASDYDDLFPLTSFSSLDGNVQFPKNSWPLRCQPYIKSWDIFRSPGDNSALWPQTTMAPPQPDAPNNDPRWAYRWTSYLLNAFMSGGYVSGTGEVAPFATTSAIASPSNVIYVVLARDDVGLRDHFHPFYWGSPAETTNGFMQGLTWDSTQGIPKEIKLTAFVGGCNYTYADGHAKFGRWSQVWWRDVPRSVYSGNFDPRNNGRPQ